MSKQRLTGRLGTSYFFVLGLGLIGFLGLHFAQPERQNRANPDEIESPCAARTPSQIGSPLGVEVLPDDPFAFELNLQEEFRRVTNATVTASISDAAKQDYLATVRFIWGGSTCSSRGLVRLSGDWTDHLGIKPERADGKFTLQPSLDIELENGIGQFQNFKLFTSGTKNFLDEIVATEILNSLGFLSPRNQMVKVTLLEESYSALMQDKIDGSLLEVRSWPSGPIYEIDEQMVWSPIGEGMTDGGPPFRVRNVNSSYSKSNGSAGLTVTARGLARLQETIYSNFPETYFDPDIDLAQLDNSPVWRLRNSGRNALYPILLHSMRGDHGLALHNRSFFYNPVLQVYEPIFYDSNVRLKPTDWWTENELNDLTKRFWVSAQEKTLIQEAIKRLSEISPALREQLIGREDVAHALLQLEIEPPVYVDGVLASITEFLSALVSGPVDTAGSGTTRIDCCTFGSPQSFSLVSISLDEHLLKTRSGFDATVCTKGPSCEKVIIASSDLHKLLRNRRNPSEFVDVKFSEVVTPVLLSEELNLYAVGRVQHQIDDKSITIELLDENSRIVFINSDLPDLKISVRSDGGVMKNPPSEHEINGFGMTGCVEFYNSTFNGTSISLLGSSCEDGVHIADSSGEIRNLSVEYSLADAVDIDRSILNIESASLRVSVNDCLDFSSSVIEVKEASLESCGDKVVSAGEGANVLIRSLRGSGTYGIISKDLSTIHTEVAKISASEKCFDTYQKKEIFGDGIVSFKQLECNGNRVPND